MGVRRYSRDPRVQRRQEQFDDLQRRVGIDYYAPSVAELIEGGASHVRPVCRDYACLHSGNVIELASLPPKLRTHILRRRLLCKCGLRRPRLELIWGEDS